MEKQDNSNVVIIDDKEYKIEDFNKEQTYQVRQIRDLQNKAANLRFQLDQLLVAEKSFTNSLIESVREKEQTNDE